jgi:hypothetical protein
MTRAPDAVWDNVAGAYLVHRISDLHGSDLYGSRLA